jgi:hypothetical protein
MDQEQVTKRMHELKAHNFILGKDQSGFKHLSSTNVGMYANST